MILKDSEKNAISSIINRPSWAKSYLRLAKVKSRFSQYIYAIALCNTTIHLLQLKNNISIDQSKSLIADAEEIKNDSLKRLNGVFYKQVNNKEVLSKRDYEKEAIYRVKQSSNLIDHHLSSLFCENSSFTDEYEKLAEAIVVDKNIDLNQELFISFLIKTSLLPLLNKTNDSGLQSDIEQNKQVHFTYNSDVSKASMFLGRIYQHGLFGETIDIEKSVYYYKQCIKNENETGGYSYFYLGLMHHKGLITKYNGRSIINEFKAKIYWLQGAKFNSEWCFNYLNNHFGSDQEFLDLKKFKDSNMQ